MHSFAVIHENRTMARPSKTELFQAHFMASKVDFEKWGPIQWSHISADAHCHAEFEYVFAFDENHLARPIVKDYVAQFSILGSFSTGIRRHRRTSFSHFISVYQPPYSFYSPVPSYRRPEASPRLPLGTGKKFKKSKKKP